MQHILVYSDSASWGIIPQTRRRLAFEVDADQRLALGRAPGAHIERSSVLGPTP